MLRNGYAKEWSTQGKGHAKEWSSYGMVILGNCHPKKWSCWGMVMLRNGYGHRAIIIMYVITIW